MFLSLASFLWVIYSSQKVMLLVREELYLPILTDILLEFYEYF